MRCHELRSRSREPVACCLGPILVLVLVYLLIPPPVIADESQAPLVSPLLRATIAVNNIDASLELYSDVLGLKVWRDMEIKGDKVNEIVGTQGKDMRIVILQSGDATLGHIALFEFTNDESRTKTPIHNAEFEVGEVALVMNTTDIKRIHTKVKEKGYVIVSPPTVLFQVPNMLKQTYEMMFISPDGVAINVIERGIAAPDPS